MDRTKVKMFEHVEVDLGYGDLECSTSETGRIYLHPSEDQVYPSITTVLKVLSEEGIAKWRKRVGEEEANKISYRASTRGTAVHEIVEKYIDNREDYSSGYMPNIVNDFRSLKPILDQRIGKVYAQEVLYSQITLVLLVGSTALLSSTVSYLLLTLRPHVG